MKSRIKKDELLKILHENCKEHRETVTEALEGYKNTMIVYLEGMIESVKSGRQVEHHISLVQPMDQTTEYKRTILMIEMTQDDVIELSAEEFANFVQDDWSWSHQFLASNARYSSKAAAKM